MIVALVSSVLALSLGLNAFLFFKLKKIKTSPPQPLELRQFAADLFRGEAMLRVTRINPDDILIRSPRNYG